MDDNIAALDGALSLSHKSSTSDQLCSICREFNFQLLLGNRCKHFVPGIFAIELGSLQRISSTTSCAVCRLVSSCISHSRDDVSLDAVIQLCTKLVVKRSVDQTTGQTNNAKGSIYCIAIQTCRHLITSRAGQQLRDDPCRWTEIGTILPARPYYNREDVGSETDYSGAASEEAFKTPLPIYAYARHVAPQINTRLVREWIACCTAEHHECRETSFSTPVTLANIRLVDVQKKQVVLRNTDCKYLALSYVWGSGTKGLLTQSTLEKYTREGHLAQENVPRTIYDAMCLVADLGERYLWVDSLCIIQDDISDKRQYLPMMGDIFNSAMVVVVAAVENAGSGLPGLRDHERRQSRFTETIQGIDFTFGQPQLQDYLSTTIWNTRGWTYQEAQLARRALVITDAQAFWSCRERSWCEDRFTEFPIHPRVPLGYNSLFTQSLQEGSRSIFLCYMGEYCQKVKEFSSRSFSDEKDQLWAFFGILKSLLSRFPQGYIWGMPKAKLDSALLWQADNAQNPSEPLIIPAEKGGWQNLMIPSWCWISKGTEVWYDNCYESVESMVDWHEPVHLEESRPQNGSQEEEVEEERARNLQSVIFPADQISRESKVFDFALLHFTTESAILRIHTLLPNTSKICPSCSMGSATLSLLSGRDIGSIRLPLATFSGKDEIQEEFILLSSTPISDDGDDDGDDDDGDDDDVQKAEEVKYYNIMLVRWSDDNKFASRIAWTEVAKSAWEECEKQRKTILILG